MKSTLEVNKKTAMTVFMTVNAHTTKNLNPVVMSAFLCGYKSLSVSIMKNDDSVK